MADLHSELIERTISRSNWTADEVAISAFLVRERLHGAYTVILQHTAKADYVLHFTGKQVARIKQRMARGAA